MAVAVTKICCSKNITNDSAWMSTKVIYGKPLSQELIERFEGMNYFDASYGDISTLTIRKISNIIHNDIIKNENVTYILDTSEYNKVILLCFLKGDLKINNIDYLTKYVKNKFPDFTFNNKKSIELVNSYKRPLTVVFCGDKTSSFSFRSIIKNVLKSLPPYSTIIHGNCEGIDKMTGELALKYNYAVKEFYIDEDLRLLMGNLAVAFRDQHILREQPDMVCAFHPDINHSQGTKKMMIMGYDAKIPVYLYDLENKITFKGNIDNLYRR